MSFFIGNHHDSPLLHITNGHNTEEEMKGLPIANTIFHSSLPYIRVLSLRNAASITTHNGTLGLGIPNDTLSELVAGYAMLLLLRRQSWSTFRLYTSQSIAKTTLTYGSFTFDFRYSSGYFSSPSWPSPLTSMNQNSQYPSADRPYFLIQNPGTNYDSGDWNQNTSDPFVEAKFAIINIRNNNYEAAPASPIEISNNAFSAGSVDLRNYMYIRADTINSRDTVFTVNGHVYQIVNSNMAGGSTELSVGSDGDAFIKCGGEVVFVASASPRIQYRRSYTATLPAGAFTAAANTMGSASVVVIPDGGLQYGDLLYINLVTAADFTTVQKPPTLYMYTGTGNIDLFYIVTNHVNQGTTTTVAEVFIDLQTNSNGGVSLRFRAWSSLSAISSGTATVVIHKVA